MKASANRELHGLRCYLYSAGPVPGLAPNSAPGLMPGPARWLIGPVGLVAVVVLLTGCLPRFNYGAQTLFSCSQIRLDAAAALHEEAKLFLVRHFQYRDGESLQYAYYATRDTEELTRSIRWCYDFDREFRQRGVNLIRAARILRGVVVGNMGDPDPSVMMQLLGPEYDTVFPGDIR